MCITITSEGDLHIEFVLNMYVFSLSSINPYYYSNGYIDSGFFSLDVYHEPPDAKAPVYSFNSLASFFISKPLYKNLKIRTHLNQKVTTDDTKRNNYDF